MTYTPFTPELNGYSLGESPPSSGSGYPLLWLGMARGLRYSTGHAQPYRFYPFRGRIVAV